MTMIMGVVRDDTKMLDGSGKVAELNGVNGGSIPGCEIVSLLDGNLAWWSSASCSKNNDNNNNNHNHGR